MKTINKYMAIILLTVGLGGFSQISYASDDIDWNDTDIALEYDYSSQDLEISFTIEENSTPTDSYSVEFEIDNKDYSRALLYSSSRDELYTTFSIDIDEDDLEKEYEIDFKIINEDDDDTEYSDNNEDIDVSNFLDWSKLEVTSEYNTITEYLHIEVTLDDIEESINSLHRSYFKIDGKTYTSSFNYSSNDDKYYAEHKIKIDEEDLDDEYDYKIDIKNNKYEVVYQYDNELKVELTNEEIDWSELDIDNEYIDSSEKLVIDIELLNVDSNPDDDYSIELEIDNRDYTRNFIYSSSKDKLYLSLTVSIDEDDLDNYYYIDYKIRNRDTNRIEYTKNNYRLYVDMQDDNDDNDNYSDVVKSFKVIIKNHLDRKYRSDNAKVIYLKRLISALEIRLDRNDSRDDLFRELIVMLEDMRDDYESNDYYYYYKNNYYKNNKYYKKRKSNINKGGFKDNNGYYYRSNY